ncbi:MAG: hypothetical protein A3C90_02860 [Candidatus Magasanikbacteria bacterium RIFCSPHIGHO2_02_FULL_51_14]|uniref:Uncharacterized protein n=1 Tax=Candidatus Magasanikbacteria bacterium RIFCSPHIGHO2_02_FULL_51_14 TaxID=1798683 RepID=A0A1F6MQZ1_9BACT|nr:MAG: hypothetical protein A3C90_02860 [Candidatus Magasanikbacteria bacterium RIFCSPHIGHO2_02_FULL_51_14]
MCGDDINELIVNQFKEELMSVSATNTEFAHDSHRTTQPKKRERPEEVIARMLSEDVGKLAGVGPGSQLREQLLAAIGRHVRFLTDAEVREREGVERLCAAFERATTCLPRWDGPLKDRIRIALEGFKAAHTHLLEDVPAMRGRDL